MKYLLFSILSLIILHNVVLAEEEDPIYPGGKMSGVVLDSINSAAVEFANIALYSATDSMLITGAITNEIGEFALTHIPDGDYYLIVHFIGYENKILNGIEVRQNDRRLDLGNIYLNTSAIQLAEAEIVAQRSMTEYKLDRKVINVSQDISNTGASAAQVLEKSPSVRVDIEGNVLLRGSSNYTVFIDGKPSVLDGNEALQQIPANTIENIEIITNPSAKYDPDGTAGIINIVLKKNRLQGFSGVVDVTAGTGDKYASDLYMNYKTGKFSFYGGVDWNDRKYPGKQTFFRESYRSDTTDYRSSEGDQEWMRNGLNFKAGLDYYISEKSNLSLGGEYGDGGFGWNTYSRVHDYTVPQSIDSYYIDNNEFSWERNFYSLNAAYLQKFNEEGHQLRLFAFYSQRDGSQAQDKTETATDSRWEPTASNPLLIRSLEAGPSQQFRFETDYIIPVMDKGKVEAGYHFRFNDESEDYYLENYDYGLGEWVVDDLYTKYTTFNRSIHAIYGIFSHEIQGFQYQIGIRGEYTDREIVILNTDEKAVVERFDYFPSVHIAKSVDESNQFMASYSRRIDRPRSYYLEPFVTYVNEDTRRIGNPMLLPEYTDSYELGYIRALNAGSFTVETYFRDTKNKITRVTYYVPDSAYFVNTYQNLNNEKALGVESSLVYDFTSWFNLNLSGTYYYYQVEDLTGESGSLRSSNNWDGRLATSFKLKTQTRLQLNFAYDSPTVTAQGEAEGSFFVDFTLKQEFLKKNLSVTLKVADIFDTRKSESYRYGDSFYEYEYNKPESRAVSLTLSYRLNNFKQNPAFMSNSGDGGGM